MSPVLRLAMWSGPRNVSTALMRSWENREDTIVVDEPFYAHYLKTTGVDHPGRDEVIANQENDWRRVAESLHRPLPDGVRVFYQKQMSHHLLPNMGREWLAGLTHAFLIRDPRQMLASLNVKLETFEIAATGLPQQVEIFEYVVRTTGLAPAVIDSSDLLADPAGVLGALCAAVGVPFSVHMLSWPPGRRDSDGVWAKHWYERVERSTGFEPRPPEQHVELSPALEEIERQCRPLYERLHSHRLKP